ncbi:YbhB/YbcL family Raf kinase inhibitor-like protein [Celeribacter arenosi]|uniref:YbhB/YbcL family Raf kinase inhibitor-like protein n=1 Tax=Celeribacter arenosi TaxID=792649 RepID=A0ABP7K784_9RHOB
MTSAFGRMFASCVACLAIAVPVAAQDAFVLSSPAITDGGNLPPALKCTRDGGDGLSPPLDWGHVPEGTESLALIMHHYPKDTVEGVDPPSQYWLLWNIPAQTTTIPQGNPASIGDEGSDKDGGRTGYTPPCSPPGARHEYTITLYALNHRADALPTEDSVDVNWVAMTDAIADKVIGSTSISFWN